MKSGGADAAAERQLTAEIEWLVNAAGTEWRPRCDTAGPIRVDRRTLHALVRPELATRIEEILYHAKLARLLKIIGQHNSQPRELPGRRLPSKDHFLLAPNLFQVLSSVEARNELRQKLPLLDQPAAEVRDHLRNVAASCKTLAALVRKGPQPHVALAAETKTNDALNVFARWTELFEAADGSERQVVAFAELLQRAAHWFDARSAQVQRSKQNRHTGKLALRMRATEFLVDLFKRRLGHPYHAHVATIATIISGIETDADFVKKVEARQSEPDDRRVGDTLARKKGETVT